jgi:hypothetical protein
MNKSRKIRWAGHAAHVGAKRNACKSSVETSEGEWSRGRPRHRSKDNINMNLKGIVCGNVN